MKQMDRVKKLITFGIVALMVVVGVVLIILIAGNSRKPSSYITPTPTPTPSPVTTVTPIPGEEATPTPTDDSTPTPPPAKLIVTLEDPSSKVNLRYTASIEEDNIIAALENDTVLTPMDIAGQWVKVTYQGDIGFIKSDFVKLSGTLGGKIQLEDPNSTVNLRAAASTESNIVTELRNETALEVTSITSDWIGVKLQDGRTGFVKSDFVKLVY